MQKKGRGVKMSLFAERGGPWRPLLTMRCSGEGIRQNGLNREGELFVRSHRLLLIVVVLLAAVAPVQASIILPGLFTDHMVLQRDIALPVWGSAQPGEIVTVTIGDRKASAQADENGRWRVRLDPLPAGGPLEMTIKGSNTITLKDVLVGEVWVCSGQSNMGWTVNRSANATEEIAAAGNPKIRLFDVPRRMAIEPQTFLGGQWEVCSPETAGTFSAVGYFFGRELQKAIDVPVGLINSSWGGTPAESWTPRHALEADPDYKPIFERWEQLKARWQAESQPASSPTTRPQLDPRTSPQRPMVLYNGMIQPLVPYAIRGAIWYQGESNAARAYQYRKLFPTMIRSWREAWGQDDFPFLFVQLANFKAGQKAPYSSAWAELREAQTMTLSLPKTGMAVTIDIGDPKDIHPINKQDVGKRLALAARAIVHGEKIPYSGPIYEAMAVEGGKIRLRYKHTDGGLVAKNGALKGFGIAGADQKFVDAEAAVDGDSIVVSSEKVASPVAVRYAWGDAPECNLYNGAGLPASPFRTDDWPGLTAKEN